MSIVFQRAGFTTGHAQGIAVEDGLVFDSPAESVKYSDAVGGGLWERAYWTSEDIAIGFGATELIPSWTADTPQGTWLQIEIRGTSPSTPWYELGRWAYGDADIHRTSVRGQKDEHGSVAVDTLVTAEGSAIHSYQVRINLYRRQGSADGPTVRAQGTMASAVPRRSFVPVSEGGEAWGIALDVPRRSQHLHDGHYPRWVGGGRRWCGPTSTTMVLGYWGRWPSAHDVAWVPSTDPNPEVDYSVRHIYDYGYRAVGNWPFNVAYAGRYGLEGFVTRLRSLAEAESFIAAGIPLVASMSFLSSELEGAGYDTDGHLMIVSGFTPEGDVVAHDPAAPDNDQVRRTYPRASFENLWLRSTSSGGIVYVIHPSDHALPPAPPTTHANW